VAQKERAELEKLKQPQGLISLPAVGRPVPRDKVVDYVVCGPAACQEVPDHFKEAAKVLGWHVKVINAGVTPESTKAAMAQVVRDSPDAVAYEGLDSSVFQSELAALKDKKIPVIAGWTVDEPDPPHLVVLPGPSVYGLVAKMAASQAVASAAGGTIGHVTVPAFPIYSETIDPLFRREVKNLCPSCKVKEIKMPVTSIGKDSASRIVGYLRGDRDVKVLVHDQDATSLGLGAAMRGASLDGVESVGIYPTTANMPNLRDGTEVAFIPNPYHEIAWLQADALARIFVGESPEPSMEATAPAVLWTKDNVPEVKDNWFPPLKPDYQRVFKDAWG
jgi:ribose transport system substrate-binding protein